MGARQSEAVSGRGPLSSPTPPPAQPGKGQGCPLQAPPRAAAHSCRWGLQPLGSEIGGHPADEEEVQDYYLLMRMSNKSPGHPRDENYNLLPRSHFEIKGFPADQDEYEDILVTRYLDDDESEYW